MYHISVCSVKIVVHIRMILVDGIVLFYSSWLEASSEHLVERDYVKEADATQNHTTAVRAQIGTH